MAVAEERLRLPTQVEIPRVGSEPLLTPGEVVGSPLGPRGPPVDAIYASSGRALRAADEGRRVAVLERGFAAYHDLPPRGTIQLPGGRQLRYVGVGGSPEYFMVTRPGGGDFGGAEAQFAVIFTSLRSAQDVAGKPVVNDAVMRLAGEANVPALKRELEQGLNELGLSGEVTTLGEEPAHRVLYKDASGDQKMFNVFAFLILAGAALAAFNLATRIVEAQRARDWHRDGAGRPTATTCDQAAAARGPDRDRWNAFRPSARARHGRDLRGVLEDLLPLPEMRTPFEPAVFARAAICRLLPPIIATAIPVWRGLRQTPAQAIRVGFRSARGSGLAALAKHLRLPGSSVAQMPLRNALRAPRRTLLTVLGIGAVLSVLVAFLGTDRLVQCDGRSQRSRDRSGQSEASGRVP